MATVDCFDSHKFYSVAVDAMNNNHIWKAAEFDSPISSVPSSSTSGSAGDGAAALWPPLIPPMVDAASQKAQMPAGTNNPSDAKLARSCQRSCWSPLTSANNANNNDDDSGGGGGSGSVNYCTWTNVYNWINSTASNVENDGGSSSCGSGSPLSAAAINPSQRTHMENHHWSHPSAPYHPSLPDTKRYTTFDDLFPGCNVAQNGGDGPTQQRTALGDDAESALLRDLLKLNLGGEGRIAPPADAESYFKSLTDYEKTTDHPHQQQQPATVWSSGGWTSDDGGAWPCMQGKAAPDGFANFTPHKLAAAAVAPTPLKLRPIVGHQNGRNYGGLPVKSHPSFVAAPNFCCVNNGQRSNSCDEEELKLYHQNLELQQSIYESVYKKLLGMGAVSVGRSGTANPLHVLQDSAVREPQVCNQHQHANGSVCPPTPRTHAGGAPAASTKGGGVELQLCLEECTEQYRQLEKERKKTEAELARHNLGKRISSANQLPIPRLPPAPSRIDRLVVDFFREHARVVTLLGKMEQLRGRPVDQKVHAVMREFLDAIRLLQQCRLSERTSILCQLRGEMGRYDEERETSNLVQALSKVGRAVLRARAANWCSLVWTIKMPGGRAGHLREEQQLQIDAILCANFELAPPEIKLQPV